MASDFTILLSVRVQPEGSVVEVPLEPTDTANSIVSFCRYSLNLAEGYYLSGDFDGFEKRFDGDERLYSLVKRLVIKNNDRSIRFYLRRAKKIPTHRSFTENDVTAAAAFSNLDTDLDDPTLFHRLPSKDDSLSSPCLSALDCTDSAFHSESTPSPSRMSPGPPPVVVTEPCVRGLSYAQMVAAAERNKQHIAANSSTLATKEALLATRRDEAKADHASLASRASVLRQRVAAEESSLAATRNKRTALSDGERTLFEQQEAELQAAKRLYTQTQAELERAAQKVEELQQRVNEQRQTMAARGKTQPPPAYCELERVRTEATSRERALEAHRTRLLERREELQRVQKQQTGFVENSLFLTRNSNVPKPRAAVEPFQVYGTRRPSNIDKDTTDTKPQRTTDVKDVLSSLLENEPPSAYLRDHTIAHAQTELRSGGPYSRWIHESKSNSSVSSGYNSTVVSVSSPAPPPRSSSYTNGVVLEQRSSTSSSGSPVTELCRDRDSLSSNDSMHAKKPVSRIQRRQFRIPDSALMEEPSAPDLIPPSDRSRFAPNKQQHIEHIDKVHVRGGTPYATKRLSWAKHHSDLDIPHHAITEAERIGLLMKGSKNCKPVDMSWIFDTIPRADMHPQPPSPVAEEPSPPALPPSQTSSPSSSLAEDPLPCSNKSPDHVTRVDIDSSLDSDATTSSAPPSSDEGSPKTVGILKKPNAGSKSGRRITFNPLALLLDAALEGELDLVKKSAKNLSNVSTCNDEGITALHNAICAGHYDIVRFLVEADADVNAQDADGWTPLHCAASCNNLPMVKFLIEYGACVFATTLSDHETPAEKCEEDEDGFQGCSQFLISIQDKLGVLNDGRTYAAYDRGSATQGDELEFKCSDEIVVVSRDEPGWWWCRSGDKEGYVPRNYLALYPRLAAQRTLNRHIPDSFMLSDENNNSQTEAYITEQQDLPVLKHTKLRHTASNQNVLLEAAVC